MTAFQQTVLQAEEELVFECCQALRLDHGDATYVIARLRRTPGILDITLAMGGGVGDYIRMILEARPPLAFCR